MLLKGILPSLRDIGFDIEPFGDATFAVRAFPAILSEIRPEEMLRDYLRYAEEECPANEGEILLGLARTASCHGSVPGRPQAQSGGDKEPACDARFGRCPFYVPSRQACAKRKEKLLFYEGPVWYEKTFPFTKHEHTRVFAYFGAVNYRARVYLNGEMLGEHEGGFTPFEFEVTKLIHDGENFIVVEANNQRRKDAVPGLNTDWWNYGGITRDVTLIETPETFVRDYWIQLARGSREQIDGWVQLDGDRRGQQSVAIEIPEAGIKASTVTDADGRATFRIPAKLQLWSPKNPKLYDVRIASSDNEVHDAIGFRTHRDAGLADSAEWRAHLLARHFVA